jgi:alkylated DNA repair dioxygenase AlkB/uncharacterized Zn-finger protein
MTYEKYFLAEDETIALYAACINLPWSRQLTIPWGKLKRHQVVSFTERPNVLGADSIGWASERLSYVGPHFTLAEAPQEIQSLAAKLSAHTGKDINYLSVVLYEDGNDHMAHHQHREDKGYDATVYIVSTGAIRPFELRDVHTGTTRTILAEPGSLITMSSAENDTHTHAVPKCKARTPRISINCKSVGPRVYSCRKGNESPQGAVYVGRETPDRKTGGILQPDTPFGNYKKLPPDKFREYAIAKMKEDSSFYKQVYSLRGKDLLCWCTGKECENCHARVWLEIANSKEMTWLEDAEMTWKTQA